MRKSLLVIVLIIGARCASAQNWQTVRLKDTVFYSVRYPVSTYMLDSNLVRTMWVDSANAVGVDSLFYFFRGIRISTPFTGCQDTAAASWLGSQMLRKPDGTEYYFNSGGDTVRFRTTAGLSETWILAKDAAGRTFQGTVTQLGMQSIEGVLDSVKTISIQAINGGVHVADPYNTLVFQLSKSHGWLKTLDLHLFPNLPVYVSQQGLQPNPNQHQRLPRRFETWVPGNVDLPWRFAPGNDFITTYSHGVPMDQSLPDFGSNQVIAHDSVLTFTPLSVGKAAVTFFTRRFTRTWDWRNPGRLDTWIQHSLKHTFMSILCLACPVAAL